jgi:hypothetical protein
MQHKNQYTAMYQKQTTVVDAHDITAGRRLAGKLLGVPTDHEWRIHMCKINHRVRVNFRLRKDDENRPR